MVQVQKWNGKETTIKRRLVDGKMVVVSTRLLLLVQCWMAEEWSLQFASVSADYQFWLMREIRMEKKGKQAGRK